MRVARDLVRVICTITIAVVFVCAGFAQQATGTLRGQLIDELGGVIVRATVTLVGESGDQRTVTTNGEGRYVFGGLTPGRYTVRATAPGFATYENTAVEISPGRSQTLNISLSVTIEKQEVTVNAEPPLSTAPENNAGAIVLRGTDLQALPDDPDDLAEALQALAGPSAGPNGGQLYIDGFSGGILPSKESIREIRINSNPFSAEYDRLGFGRIEIFTKPGSDKLRGTGFFNFSNQSLNSRNPFATNRPPFQRRFFGGNLSGPIIARKASFFVDFDKRDIDDDAVVNATILDPSFNVIGFRQTVATPVRRLSFSPRIDYQLNQKNTLVFRYELEHNSYQNLGVGNFSLPSRAYNSTNTEHNLRLTETAVINQKTVNETRFQFRRTVSDQEGDNTRPTINVLDAFIGGGSQVGISSNTNDRIELQNYTSMALGKHALKFGGRLRRVSITDVSPQNFGGTYTFGGGPGRVNSLEQYRRTLLGLPGGGPTQFSIAGGNPKASVTQVDIGPFVQDDWHVRQNLTLSLGLRYETQTNISSNLNFAPRVAFAYSPGAVNNRRPTTVIRGGFGIFYERFGENFTLQAERFNGINQQQFIVTDPAILALYPDAPSVATLAGFAQPQTIRRVAPDLRASYTIQSAISVERQLPYNITISVAYINARSLHLLRSRNINAPLPGTFLPGVSGSGVRPFGNIGNIYEYESSGVANQNQLIVTVNSRLNRKFTLFGNYSLNKANSNTDGAGTFPANQYDLSTEYGRSSIDVRQRLFLGGSFSAPWGLRFYPFVIARSGIPFNITTGRDTSGSTVFTERPAFALDPTKPGVVSYNGVLLDPRPAAGEIIIPRNFGAGPAFFSVNLRVSKTIGFGEVPGNSARSSPRQQGGRGGEREGRMGGPFGRPGEGDRGGGGSSREKRYNLTFSVQAQNLFNHTNPGQPVGNLSSLLFGISTQTAGGFGFGPGGNPNSQAGNRVIEAQIRFNF